MVMRGCLNNFWILKTSQRNSWLAIKIRDLAFQWIKLRIGDGKNCRFWTDNWYLLEVFKLSYKVHLLSDLAYPQISLFMTLGLQMVRDFHLLDRITRCYFKLTCLLSHFLVKMTTMNGRLMMWSCISSLRVRFTIFSESIDQLYLGSIWFGILEGSRNIASSLGYLFLTCAPPEIDWSIGVWLRIPSICYATWI